MTQYLYPQIITPGQQRIWFGQEGMYGVAPVPYAAGSAAATTPASGATTADVFGGTPQTALTSTVFLEPCQAITSAIQRNPYEAREYTGVPADLFDMIETTHHTTITITTPWRSNGIAAWALAALMGSTQGGAAEVSTDSTNTSGGQAAWGPDSTQQLHELTPNKYSNVCNTFTIWHDQGDAQFITTTADTRGVLQMSAATVESLRLTFTPNTALMAEITLQARFPSWIASVVSGAATLIQAPDPTVKLGSELNNFHAARMMGFQGVPASFGIVNSKGAKYSNQVLSGDLTITRTVEVIESPYSQDPTYFLPGPIAVTGTMNFLYDGLGSYDGATVDANYNSSNPSILQDYLNFATLGSRNTNTGLPNQNQIRYKDSDGGGFDLVFYPIKWTSFTLDTSGQSLKVNAGFTSFNSLYAAQQQNRISSIYRAQILNNCKFTMLL
jgi:hypothetical protein